LFNHPNGFRNYLIASPSIWWNQQRILQDFPAFSEHLQNIKENIGVRFTPGENDKKLAPLSARGIHFVGPNSGFQACGDVGAGRMSEPAEIFESLQSLFAVQQDLADLSVTITAGPTREAIDPVRYISNHSSGKMGFAIADAFAKQGAKVTLITGPVNLATPKNVIRVDVLSAQEMAEQAVRLAEQSAIFIGCAAVADYRVAEVATQKIKKTADRNELTLKLVNLSH